MIGVELVESAQVILALAQEQGLLLDITANNVLRLLPPYIISKKDIDYAMSILDGVLRSITEKQRGRILHQYDIVWCVIPAKAGIQRE